MSLNPRNFHCVTLVLVNAWNKAVVCYAPASALRKHSLYMTPSDEDVASTQRFQQLVEEARSSGFVSVVAEQQHHPQLRIPIQTLMKDKHRAQS